MMIVEKSSQQTVIGNSIHKSRLLEHISTTYDETELRSIQYVDGNRIFACSGNTKVEFCRKQIVLSANKFSSFPRSMTN